MSEAKHVNRLIHETSPYLLQHAHNPVNWYPWSPEALTRAREQDTPILLSIGYSACHWCHVMERESFENEEIARIINESFVPIKVDREERPDIDDIYMGAVQMMTGTGGWPLTVFLTPDLKPFFGGTYFPPNDHFGRPGFKSVLQCVAQAYREEPGRVATGATALSERLRQMDAIRPSDGSPSRRLLTQAVDELKDRFDPREGGFSPAPKFPPSGAIFLLLRHYQVHEDEEALAMALLTLDKMAAGGLYDHLGGGFHRYSTDERWLVPHFEKMLYDNALLAEAYLDAFQLTRREAYARVARETLDYVLREMQSPEGGYCSSQDADSEGTEGKFYVWSYEEVQRILGERAPTFCQCFDVRPHGNWEGHTILNRRRTLDDLAEELKTPPRDFEKLLEGARHTLFQHRDRRVRPGLDDKILTSWNGLMIIAMARGYRILRDQRFLDSGRRTARFILDNMMHEGRLLATYRKGRARLLAYLDDYASLMGALIELYAADFDVAWLDQAQSLADEMVRLFWDSHQGGFYFTGSDHEPLLLRRKSALDGATPSGNAVAARYLIRLSAYTGEKSYERRARETMKAFHALSARVPSAFTHMLCALDDDTRPRRELVVVGAENAPETRRALQHVWRVFAPHAAMALLDPNWPHRRRVEEKLPLLRGKSAEGGGLLFYLCENTTCRAPTRSLEEIEGALFPRGVKT